MKKRFLVLCAAVSLLAAGTAFSTTVIQPSFDELVSKAELIFVGEAVDTRSVLETTRDGRRIVTIVTFDVSRVIKGSVGIRTQLTFLGGTVGDEAMDIAGMPKFQVGDRDVLFVSSERSSASPLIGMWHGRFRVVEDPVSGQLLVRSYDGKPLLLGLDARQPSGFLRASRGPLVLSEFESAVRQRLAAASDRNRR